MIFHKTKQILFQSLGLSEVDKQNHFIKPSFEYLKNSSDVLLAYHAHCELREHMKKRWEQDDLMLWNQCEYLYAKYGDLQCNGAT